MTLTVRRTLWSDDYDSFTDAEKKIWDNADPQTEKIYDGDSEYFVVYHRPAKLPEPTPEIPRQTFLGALVRMVLWVGGLITFQLALVLLFFTLVAVLHFVGVLPPL